MHSYKLLALPRDKTKKASHLLKEGFIPGVLYGPGIKSHSLKIPANEFLKVFHGAGTSQIISLELEGELFPTLVHAFERDPISSRLTHIDFYHITKGHKVVAPIPLVFSGVCSGVKDKGGTLVIHLREVQAESLPEKLPPSIEVDISRLQKFGDEILVSDLVSPEGVTLRAHGDVVIASLLEPRKEEAKVIEEVKEEGALQEQKQEEVKEKKS